MTGSQMISLAFGAIVVTCAGSSTAWPQFVMEGGEGRLRGQAAVVHSRGTYNLRTSQALMTVEEARRRSIQNQIKATQAYYDRKRIRAKYRHEREFLAAARAIPVPSADTGTLTRSTGAQASPAAYRHFDVAIQLTPWLTLSTSLRFPGPAQSETHASRSDDHVVEERDGPNDLPNSFDSMARRNGYEAIKELYDQKRARVAERARRRAQKRLGAHQFDAASGEIVWPTLLQDERFADTRHRLDTLFGERTREDGVGSRTYVEICNATDEMRTTLDAMIRELDANSYGACRNFLKSLIYEARFPANSIQRVAAK